MIFKSKKHSQAAAKQVSQKPPECRIEINEDIYNPEKYLPPEVMGIIVCTLAFERAEEINNDLKSEEFSRVFDIHEIVVQIYSVVYNIYFAEITLKKKYKPVTVSKIISSAYKVFYEICSKQFSKSEIESLKSDVDKAIKYLDLSASM